MRVSFADRRLGKLVNDDRKLWKELGKQRAIILRRRLAQLQDAQTLEEVRYLPGNYHELKNNRKGQWACDLDQPYRLVFKPDITPVPINEQGQYCWAKITGITIIELINYHH